MDDFLSDSAALFGEAPADDGTINYGPLVLTVAQKEGKANTLLADHLFSPSLLLAELLETGVISLKDKSVIELGAGCALPSLLAATLAPAAPALAVVTDYPDDTILRNLHANVARNAPRFAPSCKVHAVGYEWGTDARPLLAGAAGFDVVIMSDLLHFDRAHDVLVGSLAALLRRAPDARAYIAAGKYTQAHVCDHFVQEAEQAGFVLEDGEVAGPWSGLLEVSGGGLDREQLGVRKHMCRWWTGRWNM
ncbi:uncharacterized protein BXZ73DRAFT_53328 [Epithele typhae]|uniref:uncharacterized protein n=1 Tax=Epithele typhae TaxID=378194 RepID=UPI002007BA74|nr:uncharacterized protein BXZ73DRAFT_53328 [Epithele typhae]KAH9917663.1 hypothetical protein BXZ73DRAFT_53328 [Epithele typhae]